MKNNFSINKMKPFFLSVAKSNKDISNIGAPDKKSIKQAKAIIRQAKIIRENEAL